MSAAQGASRVAGQPRGPTGALTLGRHNNLRLALLEDHFSGNAKRGQRLSPGDSHGVCGLHASHRLFSLMAHVQQARRLEDARAVKPPFPPGFGVHVLQEVVNVAGKDACKQSAQ